MERISVGRWLKELSIRDKETCGHFQGWYYACGEAHPCRIVYDSHNYVEYETYRYGNEISWFSGYKFLGPHWLGVNMEKSEDFYKRYDTDRDRLLLTKTGKGV